MHSSFGFLLLLFAISNQEATQPAGEFTNSFEMQFQFIPAGEFIMGSRDRPEVLASRFRNSHVELFESERPLHRVRITKPFFMSATEVTQGVYKAITGDNPSWSAKLAQNGTDSSMLPVEKISWYDACKFCNLMSEAEGLPPYYDIITVSAGSAKNSSQITVAKRGGDGYRLPTEAEWEYACRAHGNSAFCFGDAVGDLRFYAWYAESPDIEGYHGTVHPVGKKKPNTFGLYDMHGNVAEWCADWYGGNYYSQSQANDPAGPSSGVRRVQRGGSWGDRALACRAAFRHANAPHVRSHYAGLRIVVGAGALNTAGRTTLEK